VPVTPEVRTAVRGELVSGASLVTLAAIALCVYFALVGDWFLKAFDILVVFGSFWWLRGLWRDLFESSYLSTTGLIRCERGNKGEYHLEVVGGRRLSVPSNHATKLYPDIGQLTFGTVDYTEHSGTVIEVREHTGRLLYRHPEYWPRTEER
jgi:hypothetical protein